MGANNTAGVPIAAAAVGEVAPARHLDGGRLTRPAVHRPLASPGKAGVVAKTTGVGAQVPTRLAPDRGRVLGTSVAGRVVVRPVVATLSREIAFAADVTATVPRGLGLHVLAPDDPAVPWVVRTPTRRRVVPPEGATPVPAADTPLQVPATADHVLVTSRVVAGKRPATSDAQVGLAEVRGLGIPGAC